ncbi:MAG TPA: DivIVA domain-containing protein [Gaiellaceae bacterium]|jgi:cell division initiation protein|nr:DivIVA domain-containing protein [Gaiellaceae bacterium]
MFLSPPEIQHQKLKSRLGSYDREEVDDLLENVASSYEQVWHERDAARGRIDELEQQLRDYEELERLLRDSLVTGQRAAEEVKSEAAKQAEAMLREAQREADKIVAAAERERAAITTEITRLKRVEDDVTSRCRALLTGALEAIGQQEAPNLERDAAGRAHEVAAQS